MVDIDALRDRPLFVGLTDDQITKIVGAANELEFPAGREIIVEGDAGNVLLDGEVEIRRASGRAINRLEGNLTLFSAEEGDFFGELSILDMGPRAATVRAVTPVRLLAVERDDLFGLFDEAEPKITLLSNMVRILSRRFRRILDALDEEGG